MEIKSPLPPVYLELIQLLNHLYFYYSKNDLLTVDSLKVEADRIISLIAAHNVIENNSFK